METNHNKNVATFTHLSALSQYFIPFGGFILPIVIWSSTKNDSRYIDHHGTQAINFQLSIFLYSLLLAMIAIPVLLLTVLKNVPFEMYIDGNINMAHDLSPANITGLAVIAVMAVVIFFFIKIAEFFLIIFAAVKAANGELYRYPLTINFIKPNTAAVISPEHELAADA